MSRLTSIANMRYWNELLNQKHECKTVTQRHLEMNPKRFQQLQQALMHSHKKQYLLY